MPKYGSLDEFRSALDGIIGSTGTSRRNPSRKKKTRGRRARRNLAVRLLPEGGFEADTPEEMAALMRQMGGGGFGQAAPPAPPAPGGFGAAAARAPVRAPRKTRRKTRKPFTGQVRDPQGPVTYTQAKVIGKSIGGMAAYCPQYAHKKVSHLQALTEMGLTTKGQASAVLDALEAAGVLRAHGGIHTTAAQQARARAILAEVGGVVCPTAAQNPHGYWR